MEKVVPNSYDRTYYNDLTMIVIQEHIFVVVMTLLHYLVWLVQILQLVVTFI